MKRTALFVLAFAIMVSAAAFSGCGKNENASDISSQSSVSQTQESSEQSSQESSEETELNSGDESEAEQSKTAVSSESVQAPEGAVKTELKFGTTEPIPYDDQINGEPVTLGVVSFGNSMVFVTDDEKAESFGGVTGLEDTLREDIRKGLAEHLQTLSEQEISYSQLPIYSSEISDSLMSEMNAKWNSEYGVGVDYLTIVSISLSDDSENLIRNMISES